MADTGPPWDLPYPLPTDLVRDGADAIKDLAEATADGLSAAGGLVQVVYQEFAGVPSTTNATFTDTGMTAQITPTSPNNVLVQLTLQWGHQRSNGQDQPSMYRVQRQVGDGPFTNVYVGSQGVRQPAWFNVNKFETDGRSTYNAHMTFVDELNTSLPVTYKVQFLSIGGRPVYINRSDSWGDASSRGAHVSSFTLMEVQA